MKISELQELLEKAKEEYGDIDVAKYDREWNTDYSIEHCKPVRLGNEIYLSLSD